MQKATDSKENSADIFQVLEQLRHGFRLRMAGIALLIMAAIFFWLSLLFVLGDLMWHPGLAWRVTGAALIWSGLLVVAVLFYRRWRQVLSEESLAVRLERIYPKWHNQLINYVQFVQSGDPAAVQFAEHLRQQENLSLNHVNAACFFPRRKWLPAFGLAVGGLLISLLMAMLLPNGYSNSMLRLCLPFARIAPYTLTRMTAIKPGNTWTERGTSVNLAATFSGAMPEKPFVRLQLKGGEENLIPLARQAGGSGTFHAATPLLMTDAQYRIEGGDAVSPWFTIQVSPPPSLVSWTAQISPPAYTARAAFTVQSQQADAAPSVPVGSKIQLHLVANQPLATVTLNSGSQEIRQTIKKALNCTLDFTVRSAEPPSLQLQNSHGLKGDAELSLNLAPDQAPEVRALVKTRKITVSTAGSAAVPFAVRDDYGVSRTILEQINRGKAKPVMVAQPKKGTPQIFRGRFLLDAADLGLKPGGRVKIRLSAEDNGPNPGERRGFSRLLELVFPANDQAQKLREKAQHQASLSLGKLIAEQQRNLRLSKKWEAPLRVQPPKLLPVKNREVLLKTETDIQQTAATLAASGGLPGDLGGILAGLAANEISDAVRALDALVRAGKKEQSKHLEQAISLQIKILAALQGAAGSWKAEANFEDRADLLNRLRALTAQQRDQLKAAKLAAENPTDNKRAEELADAQDSLAGQTADFMEELKKRTGIDKKDDFAQQLKAVTTLLIKVKVYETMLLAAENLEQKKWPAALKAEALALKALLKALNIMNQWRVDHAKKMVEDAVSALKKVGEKLGKLEKRQNHIAEVTRDLTKRHGLDDATRKELGKMDKEQEKWKDLVEQLAQDLYQFPELPVSNELNSKMREIFEDVDQAIDSANAPSVEIAVQKEDALLKAIEETKKRVEDVEMWLPDVPDNIKWDMESFDAAELPEMPLVPLPDELEDIVGDLLDQSSDVEAQSQDSTGNNMMADGEMGWAAMDGPMPNFSAKGVSGNTKPNDNEMTGRSGAGREGQSNGELAENHVKGLEGRETHARRTHDALQKGQVTEDEDSTLKARSTGGGKLGGESQTQGMFGNAPRRDLNQKGGTPTAVRKEAEAVYATARLLYLGNTNAMGAVARDLRRVERVDRNMRRFSTVQQRIGRNLSNAYTNLNSGTVLPLAVQASQAENGADAVEDVNLKQVDESYRDMVSDYYRKLDQK